VNFNHPNKNLKQDNALVSIQYLFEKINSLPFPSGSELQYVVSKSIQVFNKKYNTMKKGFLDTVNQFRVTQTHTLHTNTTR